MEDLDRFLEKETQKHRKHFLASALASWEAEITGTDDAFARSQEEKNAVDAAYADKGTHTSIIKRLQDPQIKPDDRRQLEILGATYLEHIGDPALLKRIRAIETVIEKKFNTFRATVGGRPYTDNDINRVLTTSRDSNELRAAWEASKEQGKFIAQDVLDLVRMRNIHARELGFDNYYDFALAVQEQTREEINSVFDELHERTRDIWAATKAGLDERLSGIYGVPISELRPWHYQNLFFQEPPNVFDVDLDAYYTSDTVEITRKFFADIGLPIDDILARSSLYEQEGKSQHAFCNDFDREGDIRELCNVRNNEYWMSTLLHESGHGVYWKFMDRSLPYLLRTEAHTLVTEAVAIYFGGFSADPEFIRSVGNPPAAIDEQMRQRRKMERLVFANWTQVMVRFEQELYTNPEQDLNARWWDLVKQYQRLDFSRDAPDWASKIHLAVSPVYYHNYQLGTMLAEQLRATMAKEGITHVIGNPAVGTFFKQRLFDLGKRYRWDETIEKATGERLTAKYWAASL